MLSLRLSHFHALLTILAATLLVSCAGRQPPLSPETIAPSVLVPTDQAGITDGRGRFREIFKDVCRARCAGATTERPCDDGATLWKLAGEPPATGKPVPSGPPRRAFRVIIVPGFLAECVAEESLAFGDARGRLEEIGYKTGYIQTRGRQGCAGNADLIHEAVMGMSMPDGEKLVFVTHSKGTADTLQALVKYPAVAERTAAVVSVSGAVNGSPLASNLPEPFLRLIQGLPLSSCPQGEGIEAAVSLRRNVRVFWLSLNTLPRNVRYYSLAALTTRGNTSRVLRPFYDRLSKTDPVNDGLVLCSDAIIPGSVLLGYPNADHLAVAQPFSRATSPLLAWFINKNDYPRAVLLEAALRFVEEDLAQSGTPAQAHPADNPAP